MCVLPPNANIVPATPDIIDLDKDEIHIKFATLNDIQKATKIIRIKGHELKQRDPLSNVYIITYEQLKLMEERKIKYVLIAPP